jgi:hypothetical protein
MALAQRANTRPWRIDARRSAVQVALRGTPWRGRLVLLGGRLHLPVDGDGPVRLTAVLRPHVVTASLPGTRVFFLRRVASTTRLMLVAEGAAGGEAMRMHAQLWAGDRAWLTDLRVAVRRIAAELAVVEVVGDICCRPTSRLAQHRIHVEAAAEVIPCV